MANKGHSEQNAFGDYTHYDSNGHKIGTSRRNGFGGYTDYDAKGNKVGYSDSNHSGGYTHYDNHGHKTGYSDERLSGGYVHYDEHGHQTGSSDPHWGGGYDNSSGDSAGCYIATCVYGSYDCPEVWTLRRFRDYKLAESFAGRLFVKTYYAVSPTVVKLFGGNKIFRSCWRHFLDNWIKSLKEAGYEDTAYNDRKW